MKKIQLNILFLLLFSLFANAQPPANGVNWKLTFAEEFNGDTLNTDVWYKNKKAQCDYDIRLQYHECADRNIYIDTVGTDTCLHLKLIQETVERVCGEDTLTYDFTSGWLQTCQKFQYGYYEMRCKLPSGKSLHPGFWMFNSGGFGGDTLNKYDSTYNFWYDEIDIFESHGHPDSIEFNFFEENWKSAEYNNIGILIKPAQWGIKSQFQFWDDHKKDAVGDLSQFHTYGVEWREQYLQLYIDGIACTDRMFDTVTIPNHPMKMLITLGVENDTAAYDIDTALTVVDYVRVYKQVESLNNQIIEIGDTLIIEDVYKIDLADNSTFTVEGNGQDGGYINLRAEQAISFHAGFEAQKGSILSATIQPLDIPCNTDKVLDSPDFYRMSTKSVKQECNCEPKQKKLQEKLFGFTVSPVPSTGIVYIQHNNIDLTQTTLHFYTVVGREVFPESISKSNSSIQVNIKEKGIYLVLIKTPVGQISEKIVIH